MSKTFQQFLGENLSGFGWTVDEASLPEYAPCATTLNGLNDWWNGLEQRTRDIIGGCDLADGLWASGMLSDWPGLHQLMAGNRFESFKAMMNDILRCVDRARNQVDEQQPDAAAEPGDGSRATA